MIALPRKVELARFPLTRPTHVAESVGVDLRLSVATGHNGAPIALTGYVPSAMLTKAVIDSGGAALAAHDFFRDAATLRRLAIYLTEWKETPC